MSKAANTFSRRAVQIKCNLGCRYAAGFLRNRGVSIQEALMILAGNCIVRGGL